MPERKKSLGLLEAAAALLPPADGVSYAQSREAMFAIWSDLEPVLARFADERGGAEVFGRLCTALRSRFQQHPRAAELIPTHRNQVLGAYFDAAMSARRSAGHPRSGQEGIFIHVWHDLNLERQRNGQPMLAGKVPAKEIAEHCARLGYGAFTPSQVSQTLRQSRRTIPCPYYVKNTGD